MIGRAVSDLISRERLGAAATVVVGPSIGDKALIEAGEGIVAGSLPDHLAESVAADAYQLMEVEQNRTLDYGEESVYIETIAPQPRLVIIGAVHIGQELTTLADHLGFRVIVTDSRPAFTTRERFPQAEIHVGWPDDVMPLIELDRRTYVVILSHDARFEDPVLPWLLDSDVRYIGAMGSRRTALKRAERLNEAGYDAESIRRIHGPVGLDIGAETPGEVAVSILAEMIQVRYGHGTGLSLAGTEGRIHAQRADEPADL
ncbi:MAG: XdhC family protein [Acidimicrobiia bacterium]|nr:XdhC family protein [Acidimicrobiia bacterium]NNL47736.1 XdhC family protein [Acidimicrobiia bacterium]